MGNCLEMSTWHVLSFNVNNVIAKFLNSLAIALFKLYIIFSDLIVNFFVNSWYQSVFSLSFVTPTLNNDYNLISK